MAVYLEPDVLDRVLRQFRQVARAGSRLAISVSLSGARAEAMSRFQASVAALGEPARSTLEVGAAAEILARTGWQAIATDDAGDPDAAARRERLLSSGLLIASAGPTASAAPAPGRHRDHGDRHLAAQRGGARLRIPGSPAGHVHAVGSGVSVGQTLFGPALVVAAYAVRAFRPAYTAFELTGQSPRQLTQQERTTPKRRPL